jgi:hypothetical protein
VIWLAFALALVGGGVMSATFVTDAVPANLVALALLMWLLSLATFVVLTVRASRADGKSTRQTLRGARRTVWEFFRDFTP